MSDFKQKIANTFSTCIGACRSFASMVKNKLTEAKNVFVQIMSRLGKAVFCNKYMTAFYTGCKQLMVYFDTNRKIWYPLILLVYTIVIVVVTLSVDHTHMINKIAAENEARLAEQMTDIPAQPAIVHIQQSVPLTVEGEFSVQYDGCVFEKTIAPSKADKFGSYYENRSETNLYMDVMLTYTNLSARTIRADEAAKMLATCAGVSYNCFGAVETDAGTGFSFVADSQISAGETVQIHYIFDVPTTMETTDQSIVAQAILNNKTYYINLN